MTGHCPDWEEIEAWAGREPGDPRRAHVEGCARCRARLDVLAAFHAASAPPGARPEEARERLARFLEREIVAPPVSPRPAGGGPGRSWWRTRGGARGTRLRPALAFAAVVAVTVLAWGLWRERAGAPGGPLLRGAPAGDSLVLALRPARAAGDSLVLGWSAVAGADGYTVSLTTLDLVEVARLDAGPATRLGIARDGLPASVRSEDALLWQVEARSGGDVIATSASGRIRLR